MTFPNSPAERNAARRRKAMADAQQFTLTRIWAMEDAQIAELGQLYTDTYRSMAGTVADVTARYSDAYGAPDTWSAADAMFRARTESLLSGIYAEVQRLTDAATAEVMDTAIRGYQGGYYGAAWMLDQGLRGYTDATLPLLPVEAIRAAMLSPYMGSTFLDRFIDARTEFEQLIRKGIVESQIRGESISQAQARLREALGLPKGKSGYAGRLEMIARTEILRASNLGAMAIYEANRDVLSGWEFVTARDDRVCPVCAPLDGTQYQFGEGEIPPLHPRCRCSELPVLIDSALEAAIIGPRVTYADWAAGRSVAGDAAVLESARAYAGMTN